MENPDSLTADQQRELLAKLLQKKSANSRIMPVSFAQLRLWFLDRLAPGKAYYNLPVALRLQGFLDVEILQRCFDDLVIRHEALRTTFSARMNEPVQVVHPPFEVAIEVEDLTKLQFPEREQESRRLAELEAQTPFDLDVGPLFRVKLQRLSDDEHLLLLTIHHIVTDGWSNGILLRELSALHQAHSSNVPANLEALPIQYADFAVWQQQWLSGDELESQIAYWKKRLVDLPDLQLPIDKPRPAQQTFNGALAYRELPVDLSGKLRKLSQQSGASLFMTMLAGFGVLLQRYCGQDDIVVGSPIANRKRVELEGLIGFFVNSLVMRMDVSGDPGFAELLKRVQQTTLQAYEHQDLPFEKLIEELQPARIQSQNPLFQVMFALQNTPSAQLELSGLRLQAVAPFIRLARFDLEVYVSERSGSLGLGFIYNTDLFDAATIERMLAHYQSLLEAMVANPDMRISDARMLGDEERRQLVNGWNKTQTDYPREQTVQALFEAQVMRAPDSVALEHDSERLSYRELNDRANRLAHYLIDAGVKADAAVVVLMERTPELIIAQLAVLKSGGAYVAIDPDIPTQRLGFILQDTQSPVLLTQFSLLERVGDYAGRTLCLDSEDDLLCGQSTDNPAVSTTPENLAYVIYTSGSTGQPKGVEVSHGGLSNLVAWHRRAYEVGPADRATHLAGLGFDASVWELWPYLASGARLYLVSDEQRLAPAGLWSLMVEKGITLSFLPTPLAEAALGEPIPQDLKLRVLLTGGDRLHGGLVAEPLPFRVVNHYGPTENSVVATSTDVDMCAAQDPPIGRPIDNVQTYILDKDLQPVPVGVWGELYIGGDSLARGYLNQPQLTAEKFIPNPFSDEAGARLYRSGDLVRYRADGQIEFRGRIDHQVKLRGFRVELGEIESVLLRHQNLSDAVVIVHEDAADNKRLLAYVVAHDADVPTPTSLREFVAKSLPNYMLPSAFVILQKLPLTANGKIDRKALPVPDDFGNILEIEYVAPRNELERRLAGIWADVLKLERVGIHDNFFDLGGHSLMATRIVSHIRAQLNVELPLSEMFGYPTVAELAPVIETLLDGSDGAQAEVIPVADRSQPLPLSFAQERLWFLDQLEPGSTAYNMCLSLRLSGELDVAALAESLNTIVERQQALRTHFDLHQGKPIQIIDAISIELQQDDLSALASDARDGEVKTRIKEAGLQPFDLSTGPLLRCRLLRLSDHEHVLTLAMHHIISDGWSLGVLFRELGACYAAFAEGKSPQLAELPIQYVDFALWQRDWLSGEVLDRQLTYWQQKLKDLTPLELPVDRPRPAVKTYNGASAALRLDSKLCKKLEQLSQQAGVTPFMTLLAGFAVLMQRYCGQDDIVIGSPIANRNRSEVEQLIGFFINMLVLRLDVSGNPDFRTLLDQTQQTTLEAYQHQDIPFERLVEELQPARDRSRNPLFQIQFSLQNTPMEPLKLKGLALEPVRSDTQSTRFDLECHLWPRGSELDVFIVYNTDLFDATTIQRMLGHYHNLLKALVLEPERPIDSLPMLDEEERHLLAQWNQVSSDHSSAKTLFQLFEAQVERNPAAVAVELTGETLSYGELEVRSNRLARYLQASGVGPEVLVGLYLERSFELLVAILGVLKAGGAYVPLDPEYPGERLRFMLEDCAAPILLTQIELQARLPDYPGQLIRLDADWAEIEAQDKTGLSSKVTADNAAYVIYTSGSTGQPKGVVVTHGNVTRLFGATEAWYGFNDLDVWTLFHSSAFDFSVWEIWGALLHGGRLVVVPYAVSRSPELFHELLAETAVTVLNQTPSAFRQLMAVDEGKAVESLSSLRLVIFGGEALDPKSLGPWFARHGDQQPKLVNMYGITETTVHVSYRPLSAAVVERDASVIGQAIPDLQIYILDRHLQPVPIGVPGELYVGGAGLARGYLNRPELTRDRFIADPFSDKPGARLYKTGDLGRYLYDGDIEYLGRSDQQVKLRGFRIELGEIEAMLGQHDAVAEGVVVCVDDGTRGPRLVGYVVTQGVEEPSIADMRAYLRTRLPEYMVPAAFVVLDSMPLSVNGKLDRHALPVPDGSRQLEQAVVAPRSDLEKQLVDIWQQVLDVDQVGIHDNFFDLGGHSLKLVELHKKLSDKIDMPLTLVDLFAHPTVSALVEYITKTQIPGGARAGDVGRVTNMVAGNKRLQQLRQSRKRNTGMRKTNE